MADLKLKINPIVKGSQLQITVEEAINDILLVCLNYGSTIYRGVLMDIQKRNLPYGVSFPKEPQKPDPGGDINVNRPPNLSSENEKVDVVYSASTQRHSYIKDPFEFTNKPLQLPSSSILRRKTVRDIRLRPRKTLCTNCKSNIHDTKLKNVAKVADTKSNYSENRQITRSTRLHPINMPPSIQLRKRQLSTDDESPTKAPEIQNKVGRMNLSPRLMSSKNTYVGTKTYSRSISGKQKSTPAIKISIGGDSVLNIPPRISENEPTFKSELNENERAVIKKELTVRLTDIADQANAYSALRKVKKAVRKSKDRDRDRDTEIVPDDLTDLNDVKIKSIEEELENEAQITISSHTKKHKRKHKHERHRHLSTEAEGERHQHLSTEAEGERHQHLSAEAEGEPHQHLGTEAEGDDNNSNLCSLEWQTTCPKTESSDFLDEISEHFEEDNDNENNVPIQDDVNASRPRLVYTWKQNKGLSRVDTKFPGTKDYPLRSKDKETDKYLSPRNDANVVSYSDGGESSVSDISDSEDISESQTSDSEGFLSPDLSASPEKTMDTFKPLMMKIQTQNVSKCVTTDRRKIRVNDIIWGKIQGFPWWPGRVITITITKKDNGLVIAQLAHIAWFGSSTSSHMQCDELFPFLEDFKLRFNKKKRGPYKLAIRQATMAAQLTTTNSDLANSAVELQNTDENVSP